MSNKATFRSTTIATEHHTMGTRGSMRMAHNLDDRQERASLHNSDDDEVQKAVVADPQAVAKKFKNLGWLLK